MNSSQNSLIEIHNVSKSFHTVNALSCINLTIQAGEVVALLGANGAGKTTLINLILGRLQPSQGVIRIFGSNPGDMSVKNRTGVMLQTNDMPSTLKVIELVTLFSSYFSNAMPLDQTIETAQLTEIAHRNFGQLSGGQKQRVYYAIAICGRPDLIIMDEPTVGLDAKARRSFWENIRSLKANGTSILLTTHYLEEADALADRVLLLSNGLIQQSGTPEEIKATLGGRRIKFKSNRFDIDRMQKETNSIFTRTNGMWETTALNTEVLVKSLLEQVEDLSELSITPVSLEDAYLHAESIHSSNNEMETEK